MSQDGIKKANVTVCEMLDEQLSVGILREADEAGVGLVGVPVDGWPDVVLLELVRCQGTLASESSTTVTGECRGKSNDPGLCLSKCK